MSSVLRLLSSVLCPLVVLGAFSAPDPVFRSDIPFSAIRLRKQQTDSPAVWKATLAQFAKYRDAVDEVWFSSFITTPKMDAHRVHAARLAAAAEDVRRLGVRPSLQIHTIGCAAAWTKYGDNSGVAWQAYTAEDGTETPAANCPRAPGFHAYLAEVGRTYAAAMRPHSLWIDDDIRITGHHRAGGPSGHGCHCARCLDDFAKREGKSRTRKQLLAEMKKNPALAARWRAFAYESQALVVKAVAEGVHAASPETRVCIQHPGNVAAGSRRMYEAAHAATGLPSGMRVGASGYFDHDPREQVKKAYQLALKADAVAPGALIDRLCPEIETWPRTFSCRTGRGIVLEALEELSQGMNAISVLAIDAGYEPPDWYGKALLAPLARNARMLRRYVALNEGAARCGYGYGDVPPADLLTGSLPLNVLGRGAPSPLARLVDGTCAKAALAGGPTAVKRLLSEDLVLDGAAARALSKAGYGAEIGVVRTERVTGPLRERFSDDPLNEGFLSRETPPGLPLSQTPSYFLVPAEGARIVSSYSSDEAVGGLDLPGVAAVAFESLGGRRRVVFGHDVFDESMRVASGGRIVQLHRLADWASHGRSPVLLETPARAFVQPRVRADGTLVSVVFVNAAIDVADPVRLRFRGVPASAKKAVWSAIDAEDVPLPVVRDGADAVVTLPPVPAWYGGYVFFPGTCLSGLQKKAGM